MSLFILILRPLTTQLAIFWKDKEYKRFDGIIVKLLVIILGLGFVLTLVAYFIGTPILSVVFGLDLNRYKETLAILVFSGILYSIGIVFGDVMTVYCSDKDMIEKIGHGVQRVLDRFPHFWKEMYKFLITARGWIVICVVVFITIFICVCCL